MTYQKEFPDFVLDVTLPEGFEDTSWHNDVCPSFTDTARKLILWIDYADPDLREFPENHNRFLLDQLTDMEDISTAKQLIKTADWSEVLAMLSKIEAPA